jgi:hypothetical protein
MCVHYMKLLTVPWGYAIEIEILFGLHPLHAKNCDREHFYRFYLGLSRSLPNGPTVLQTSLLDQIAVALQ